MTDRLGDLLTEQVDDRYAGLDTASVAQLAAVMNDADATVPAAVRAALPQIVPAIEGIADRLAAGGRLLYVGAGTAGRLGVLDASECPPTFSTPPDLVRAVIAGGMQALVALQEGVEDDEAAGAAVIGECGITAATRSSASRRAAVPPTSWRRSRAARARGALTVGLSCNAGTPLSAAADRAIEVLVGPEVLTGSTRLKAGTAQKLVLNMISTISMIRLGKTYGNLMVDLRATNVKLRDRAVRIIRRVTGVSRADAEAALDGAELDVQDRDPHARPLDRRADPRQRLAASGGRLREALEASA